MRRLRQVLLVEADATGDQAISPIVVRCIGALSCGDQAYGRQERIQEPGIDVRVTVIGHAQQWEGFGPTEVDATKVQHFTPHTDVPR